MFHFFTPWKQKTFAFWSLSVFDRFAGLALKELKKSKLLNLY